MTSFIWFQTNRDELLYHSTCNAIPPSSDLGYAHWGNTVTDRPSNQLGRNTEFMKWKSVNDNANWRFRQGKIFYFLTLNICKIIILWFIWIFINQRNSKQLHCWHFTLPYRIQRTYITPYFNRLAILYLAAFTVYFRRYFQIASAIQVDSIIRKQIGLDDYRYKTTWTLYLLWLWFTVQDTIDKKITALKAVVRVSLEMKAYHTDLNIFYF